MNQPLLSDASPQRHLMPVFWVACIGIGFSLAVFFVIRSWERQNVDEAFRLAAEDRAKTVIGTFEAERAMLDVIRSALITDDRIEEREFREILEPFLARSSDILAVEWVARVPGDQRKEFEAAAQREGLEGYQIRDINKDGQLIPAAIRDEYFPVRYIGPEVRSKSIYGLDLASEPTRMESLKQARDTGQTIASGRFTFVQDDQIDDGDKDGFLLCLPVYHRNQPTATVGDRQKGLAGFILGLFRPGRMIESGVAKLQPEGIDIGLFDSSDPAANQEIHFHASRSSSTRGSDSERMRLLDAKGLHYQAKLGVAGHPWTVVCAPTPEFLAVRQTWWPSGVLAVGLVFTAMLCGYVHSSIQNRLHLEEKVREQTADIRSAQEDVLCRLAGAAQLCDEETEAHIRRIGLMSQVLARAADWFGPDLEAIRQAAPMHDIGKIGIPDAILQKSGEMTPEEFEILKNHTRIGADILGGTKVPMLQMAREIALNHHERWDGKGYPRGLAGKSIPESARIVAIVDAYDTLTHGSQTRPALSEQDALAAMRQESERQFDPNLLSLFLRHIDEMRRIADQYPDRKRGVSRVVYPVSASAASVSFALPAAAASPNDATPTTS